jgi:AraC-like DNA-binding protein
MKDKTAKLHWVNIRRKWNGFRVYLFNIIISNIFLVLTPICIVGLFWFNMVHQQAEKEFHQQKTIEIREAVSGINQRINTIKLEIALEKRDRRYSTYTNSDQYTTDLWLITKRLSSMAEKYPLLYSVYFYDVTTGRIYNSKAGSYEFDSFYDVDWLKDTKKVYTVQQLPLRYSMTREFNTFFKQYNKLVLTLLIRGVPDFYLVANISIDDLYKDIAATYELQNDYQEFFFLNSEGQLIEGNCEYTSPELLMQESGKASGISSFKKNGRIYFMEHIDCGIVCVTSYPLKAVYQESQYLTKYILFVCFGVFIFLIAISTYMAKRLYRPIDTLYSEITANATIGEQSVTDEINMLKQVFTEMKTFNSNAKLNLKQFDEISKTFSFRNYLEHNQQQEDFIKEHPYLFDEEGDGFCEMLIIKIDTKSMNMPTEEEMLFRLNLQEVLRTYLQSSMKGILTKIEDDNLVLLYQGTDTDNLEATRKVLTDTVIKLTKQNAYFSVSQPIHKVEEVINQFHRCLDLIKTSFFFEWKNQIVTEAYIRQATQNNGSYDIYNRLLNINAAFIRNVISQNEYGISDVFVQLEAELRTLLDISLIKDICNRIMVELDKEFHFSISHDINLLQTLSGEDTLVGILNLMKYILKQVSCQYGKGDAKESYYCELAKDYLDENFMRDMNITDVADHLNISYSYLSKIFRAKTGITLTDYLNNARIEKSKEYLANTFLNLNEISEKVGYNNVQSYQRFFKKYENITPGDYRKLHSNPVL